MIMIIIIVKRIRHSRHKKVYGGQFEWAINESKRNIKAMGHQCSVRKLLSYYNCMQVGEWQRRARLRASDIGVHAIPIFHGPDSSVL